MYGHCKVCGEIYGILNDTTYDPCEHIIKEVDCFQKNTRIKHLDTLVVPSEDLNVKWQRCYIEVEIAILNPYHGYRRYSIVNEARDRLGEEGYITEIGCDRFETCKDFKKEIYEAVVHIFYRVYRSYKDINTDYAWEIL